MNPGVALFGGSFDPIHFGHLIVARSVAERLDLDRVVFLPSASPPHKSARALSSPEHRAAMVRLAIAEEPRFEFSDHDLHRAGPSYTVDTVEHFRDLLGPDCPLHWIIGADSLAELTTWHRVDELVDACRIVTAHRPGWEQIDWRRLRSRLNDAQIGSLRDGLLSTPRIEISASDIRRRVREGRSIRYLVPEAVREYILRNAMYVSENP